MRLYIDKENLVSLMKSQAQGCFEDCVRAIRKDIDVQYNFSNEEIKNDELLVAWFRRFGSGVDTKQLFVPKDSPQIKPPRPLKSNFYTSDGRNGYTAVYLLNDCHMCEVVAQKSCVLIGKIGEETRIISSLFLEDTETDSISITSWRDYCPTLPVSDIVLCDNHYFKNKITYEKNDNELIKAIACIPHESPINVVIITKEDQVGVNLSIEQKHIKDIVKKATGSKKSTVTILTTKKAHDRCLITNYYRIKHGSCFHLIDSGIKADVTTEIKSHIKRNNERVTKKLLTTFQNIVDDPYQCYGDRVSNLLEFD